MKTGELGTKIECPACGTKYYDLGRPEPRCGLFDQRAACGAQRDGSDPMSGWKGGLNPAGTPANTATDQLAATDFNNGIGIDASGDVFYHGALVGLELTH